MTSSGSSGITCWWMRLKPRTALIRYTVRVEKTFEAVYENGVLRPLENLGLSDMQHVLVTISDSAVAADASGYFEPAEWSVARHDDISLETVRRALSSIRGSLSDTVIASREERL
jgi:predicted DNA-binding antitoxin AbrB/MazE fold protein